VDLRLPHDFVARPYQRPLFEYFSNGGKRGVHVWHRRSGKDLTDGHITACQAFREVGAYWHFFPLFERARKSIWEGFRRDGVRLMDNIFPGFLIAKENRRPYGICKRVDDDSMSIELTNGSIWRLMGSDKVEFVGAGPKGVAFSEFSQCKPNAWDLVRPMLRESRGWALFNFTPRGKNHAWELYNNASRADSGWFCDLKTVYDTNLTYASSRYPGKEITAVEMIAEERLEGMSENLIRQEYECDFSAATIGSIYGELLETLEKHGQLDKPFDYDRNSLFTAWDLGIGKGNQTAIWFFTYEPLTRAPLFVDYYENFGKPIEHYFGILEDHARAFNYRYLRHYLPHDARARSLQTGMSILDQFMGRFQTHQIEIVPGLLVEDGIAAARKTLQMTGLRFHPRCKQGLLALKAYAYGYDEEKKCFAKKPEHTWASNGSDAFRMASIMIKLGEQSHRFESEVERKKGPFIFYTHHPATLDELFQDREKWYRS